MHTGMYFLAYGASEKRGPTYPVLTSGLRKIKAFLSCEARISLGDLIGCNRQ